MGNGVCRASAMDDMVFRVGLPLPFVISDKTEIETPVSFASACFVMPRSPSNRKTFVKKIE